MVEIARIDGDPASHSFLEGQGIAPGATVTVLAISDDGGCLLDTGRSQVHVSGCARPVGGGHRVAVPGGPEPIGKARFTSNIKRD